MQGGNTLDIKQFLSVCHQLVLEAGKFIKEGYDSGDVVVKRKPSGEAYTDFDLKIQTFYIAAFQRFWPKLKIIGEEEQDYEKPIDFNYDNLRTDTLPSHVFEGLEQTHIDLDNNKVILWIDPIDATSQFVKRRMNHVTTLLGISVNGKAKVGIIGRFYREKGEEVYEWNPQCFFAYADYPHAYVLEYLNGNEIKELKLKERDNKEKPTCAVMYFDKPERIGIVEQFADLHKVGGAESLAVAESYCDFYVYRGLGYMKWDLCAGEAIITSLGGTATDPYGKEFIYEEEQQTWNCPDGQLICRSKEILKRALELLNPKNK